MSMDSKLSVQRGCHHHNGGISKPPVHHQHHGSGGGKRSAAGRHGGGKGIKVVYISSPMKLTTSAEEFRAVVQELTGRDSNVADHDLAGGDYSYYAGVPSSSSSSYSSSSIGRVSPTGAGAARALSPPTMAAAASAAGTGRHAAALYDAAGMAAPPPFQGIYDDQTPGGSLLYGQDYYW